MVLENILEICREEGSRLIRSRGENPNLYIMGEDHLLGANVSLEELFDEIKPKYFFCEGVQAGLEMDFIRYQTIPIDRYTQTRRGSFEELIRGALYDVGMGIAGIAITKWFSKSPKTIFVGIDLADKYNKGDQIVELGVRAVKELDDYVAEMLAFHGRELTDNKYKCYEVFRDFLYGKNFDDMNFYETEEKLEEIRKNAPSNILNKSKAGSLFSMVKKGVLQLNFDREKTMGRTMVNYVSKSNGINLAVVGAYHIRRNSHLFPLLDSNNIEYLAIDIAYRANKT